jgi:serine phosphatase RsbU (regulator of sigma subunit)
MTANFAKRFFGLLRRNPERKKYKTNFLAHLNAQARVLHRPLGAFAIVTWLGFAFDTDPKLHPEFPELFYFRMGLTFAGLIVLVMSFIKKLRGKGLGWLYFLGVFAVLSCSFFTGRIADDANYVSGLQILIMIIVLAPFPLKSIVIFNFLSMTLFVSAVLIYQPVLNTPQANYSMNNLVITYLVSLLMGFLLDRFRFNIFHNQLKLQQANTDLIQTRDKLWGEMELAKKIQTVLLPKRPTIPGYEISARMMPADEVGGDYYDIINVGNRDWVVIGDVSGHGIPSGLVMMMVQTSIQLVLNQFPDISPPGLLTNVNNVISDNIRKLGEKKYMTITVMACHSDGNFSFSGLHQDIMVYRYETNSIELVETQGMWLGIEENIRPMLEIDTVRLHSGDMMLLYTDGITEAWKKDKKGDLDKRKLELFGDERLQKIFKSCGKRTTDDVISNIVRELEGYHRGDDVTMVVLKRVG